MRQTYLTPLLDKMVDGATTDATIGGHIYALPGFRKTSGSVLQQELFSMSTALIQR